MQTKYEDLTALIDISQNSIIQFFFQYAQLKNLYRQGWLQHNIPKEQTESVADHSYGVGLLSYVIASELRPDLNPEHCMVLGMMHELGEIYGGDHTPKDDISLEEKAEKEMQSAIKTTSTLSRQNHYIDIFKEYQEGASAEAIFVQQVDKLEMALQALTYEQLENTGLDDYFPWVTERLQSPELKKIMKDIVTIRT